MERKSAIMSQIANANFHENTIVKVPMAVIPIAGRSQQRSQTRPAVIRNEIVRNRITKRINIIFLLSFDGFIIARKGLAVKPFLLFFLVFIESAHFRFNV